LVSRNVNSMFIRGLGGFGGSRGPNQPNIEIPKSNPDVVEKFRTAPNQAEIYRLSADYNPLHVDPEFAAAAGFKAPILHGLCSFGFSARAILKHFCNNDPKNFKAISVRFITPVYPGETLVIEMWRDPATRGRIIFQTKVAERNVTVISNAYVDVVDDGKNPASPAADLASEPVFKSAIVFEAMAQTIEKYPEIVKKVNAVFLFHVSSGDKKLTYTLDLKRGQIYEGEPKTGVKPECTVTVKDDDYFDVATGKIDPQQAFLKGKLKLSGNIMLAQKLSLIQQASAKL